MFLCLPKSFPKKSIFPTFTLWSQQNLELLEMTCFQSTGVCLHTPRGQNWENTVIESAGEMKGKNPFRAVGSKNWKNLGLILTFLRI